MIEQTLAWTFVGACFLLFVMFVMHRFDRWVDRKLAEAHKRNGTQPRVKRR